MSIDLSKYAGHTPGEWRVGTPGPNGCATVGTAQGLMVAVIAHSLNEPGQAVEAEANARLIADAPALLAALAAEQARAERLPAALRVIAEYQPRLSNTWNQDIDAIRHLARAAAQAAIQSTQGPSP